MIIFITIKLSFTKPVKGHDGGLFLVVQWLRICLAVQGTWIQCLVRGLRPHMAQSNQVFAPQPENPILKDPTGL